MLYRNQCGKVNIKLAVILIVVTAAVGGALVAARQIRRSILSERDLEVGQAAFERKDWQEAVTSYREYLGRRPDDVEVLRRYAQACLSVQPLESPGLMGAIAAYRRIVQLDPNDETACDKLATLYIGIGNFEELAYVARARLARDPNDRKATLRLADALIQLNKKDEARQTLTRLTERLESLPDRYPEYAEACRRIGRLVLAAKGGADKTEARNWFDKAVAYAPESAEAFLYRAQFYREASAEAGTVDKDRLALARKDLEQADGLGARSARACLSLGQEWMAHGEFERAAAELRRADSLPAETRDEEFFDASGWIVARFLFKSQLTLRQNAAAEAAPLADETLAALSQKRHRVQVLPSAILLYAAAGKAPEARRCLDEYLDLVRTQGGVEQSPADLARLQALVARAEQRPYVVINALQPLLATDTSYPELWQLAAEAYSLTDQPRRAVAALVRYLRYHPQDGQMRMQLAKEYLRLRDWSKAFEVARLAESLSPSDIVVRLLRIESSIYLAVGQRQSIDRAKLESVSTELAQLRRERPDQIDVRLLQAAVATSLEQPAQAESELKLAIEECKEPLRAEMELVKHYSRMKRTTDALNVCRTACERHGDTAEPWLVLSSLHAANGDTQAARRCLQQGLDTVTNKWGKRALSIRMALLELAKGDRAAGVKLLRDLAAQNQDDIYVRTLLLDIGEVRADPALAEQLVGELHQAEGESGLSWRLYQAGVWLSSQQWRSRQQDVAGLLQYCVTADPEWSAPVLLLAEMYQRLGDFSRVEDVCRQGLARNPAATDIADKLVSLLEKQGRRADAQSVLQQVEMDPQVASAWRIRMALQAEEFSRAIDELKLRISNDRRDADSRILLARLVYWQARDASQAFAYLKEAETIAPDSLALVNVKASILRAEGQKEDAQKILSDYVAKQNSFYAYSLRAAYWAREGQWEQAEADYRKLTTFPDEAARGYGLLSEFYARRSELDKAVATLEEGLKAYPTSLPLQRMLMRLLLQRAQGSDHEQALAILAALEQQLPQDPELMKVRALCLLQEATPQSLAAAREKLESVVRLEPTAIDAQLELIGMAMREGKYETARDRAIQALGSNPDQPALLAARGGAELALRNTRLAIELARLALQRDPNSVEATMVLAQAGLKSDDQGVLDEVRARLDAAVARDPANERLLLQGASILAASGQPQAALPKLDAYCQTEAGGRSVAALVMLADLYRLTGDMARAGQKIEQAERLDANSLTVVNARFLWLVSQKRLDELAHISSAYLSAKEQDPAVLIRAASTLLSLGPMDLKKEAVKLFEHAATVASTSLDARLGLASSLYQTGDAEGARKLYRQLLEQYPDDVRVLNDLAWILQEHDRQYAEALDLANKGLHLAPGDLHLLDTRGTILLNLPDRLADAKADFEESVRLSSADARRQAKALLQLGRICVRLDDFAQAKRRLETAMEIDRKTQVFTPDERSEISRIVEMKGTQ